MMHKDEDQEPMNKQPAFVAYRDYVEYPQDEMISRSASFYSLLRRRRSVREFSDRAVPVEIIENCLRSAGTAASGANMQPWYFVVVSDAEIKKQIRIGAEKEEHEFYHGRAPEEWLDALAPLATHEKKPFLEIAPYLIAVFQQRYGMLDDGRRIKHYYAPESVGIATGMLIAALHDAGLVCLPHTPSPMKFLNQILKRPSSERPFLLLVVGYPAKGVKVPDISKKTLAEIATFI